MSLTLLDWRRQVHSLYAAVRTDDDPAAGWARWQAGRNALFAGHPDSPLGTDVRARFGGLPVAPYDPTFRFRARLDIDVAPQHLELPTADDGVVGMDLMGRVTLGELGRIDVWWLGGYGGGLFLPLRDGSAGRTTYGGGRYLLDTIKGADLGGRDGHLVVDLNFAYHPSCTYDPRWSCPLPQAGNRIDAVVTAGEQLPTGGWY